MMFNHNKCKSNWYNQYFKEKKIKRQNLERERWTKMIIFNLIIANI